MKRWISGTILLIAMAALSAYSRFHNPWLGLDTCLRDPQSCDGRLITRYQEPRIGSVFSDGFELIQKGLPAVRVYADTTGLVPGEYLGITAVFHREGYLTAQTLHVARHRHEKIILSVIPVILIFSGLLMSLTWRKSPFFLRIRPHA